MKKFMLTNLLVCCIYLVGCQASQSYNRNPGPPSDYTIRQLNKVKNDLLANNYPESYADGYVEGCSSGRMCEGDTSYRYQKNVARYMSNNEYAKGWNNGLHHCKQEIIRMRGGRKKTTQEQECELEFERQEMWHELKK